MGCFFWNNFIVEPGDENLKGKYEGIDPIPQIHLETFLELG